MTDMDIPCDDGRGRLNGRDGEADATPTGRYMNDFGGTLAASIRGAQQSVRGFPDEYVGQTLSVYSVDNTCAGIHRTVDEVPPGAVLHWSHVGPAPGKVKTDVTGKLREATEYAATLACVEVRMTFDADAVGYTMRIKAGPKIDQTLQVSKRGSWEELERAHINLLVRRMRDDHRTILAHIRKQREDSISPHEVHSDMCPAFLDRNNKCNCGARR